ncbi:MAG: hypothetical protein H7A46_03270 [Verrucomicrobiales bacterium]|nr:hypothetical protein [Verrucomicrobiales bacterium]
MPLDGFDLVDDKGALDEPMPQKHKPEVDFAPGRSGGNGVDEVALKETAHPSQQEESQTSGALRLRNGSQ